MMWLLGVGPVVLLIGGEILIYRSRRIWGGKPMPTSWMEDR